MWVKKLSVDFNPQLFDSPLDIVKNSYPCCAR